MASIIPGYEYDIFISYRHNDNLDGWVSDFVQNLEKELKVTIKEPISIYFDTNPHDGLLETHNVDKSLQGKLKSLIFIPIISQTYCDPKSFAWQNEFCPFNKYAREDQFGLDIRLSNGNVASRILPVKIHDLDKEDTALLESELGGVLRAIEFIFSSPGVNRPLTSSDNPDKNKNQTFYRDQINKVANAIYEIIRGIRESLKIQALLARIGERMNMKIWLPRSDRNRILELWNPLDKETLLETLPLNYDDTTLKTIENIDVLWIKRRSIVRAFEVEHTTSIYSGILRMADLMALQPNLDIKAHIVAPYDRKDKVLQEITRPVFTLLEKGPLSESCTFISYDSIVELSKDRRLEYMNESVIDSIEEGEI